MDVLLRKKSSEKFNKSYYKIILNLSKWQIKSGFSRTFPRTELPVQPIKYRAYFEKQIAQNENLEFR